MHVCNASSYGMYGSMMPYFALLETNPLVDVVVQLQEAECLLACLLAGRVGYLFGKVVH